MKWVKYISMALVLFFTGAVMSQPKGNGQEPATSNADNNTAKSGNDNTTNGKNEANLWLNPDYKSYVKALDDLIKLSDDYAQNKYRLALANYQTGKSLIQKMRENVRRYKEESEETIRLNEKWFWQTMDRKSREEKKISEDKRTAKLKAVTYFTRAIRHLDEIESQKVKESPEFKALLSNIYRDWAMAQYDLGNIPQIIDVLNRYIALDPKYEEIPEPHKYLASAYAFQEKLLEKYGKGSEQDLIRFKKLKNQHLLRATELIYGKNTPEYNHMMEVINKDEIIAISPP